VLHGHDHHEVIAKSVPLTDDLLGGADCVVITTDHTQFDIKRVVDKAKLVVDTRNATAKVGKGLKNVIKL
jgi:UDP-N-acetyl-D-glucosamine dehydrogenase